MTDVIIKNIDLWQIPASLREKIKYILSYDFNSYYEYDKDKCFEEKIINNIVCIKLDKDTIFPLTKSFKKAKLHYDTNLINNNPFNKYFSYESSALFVDLMNDFGYNVNENSSFVELEIFEETKTNGFTIDLDEIHKQKNIYIKILLWLVYQCKQG